MKNSRSFSCWQIFCAVFLGLAVSAVFVPHARAQTSGNWTGTTSGNLSVPANWSSNSTVNSTFTGNFNNATYTNAPNATAPTTAMGKLYIGPSSGALTFGTSTNNITLSGVSGVGIEVASGAGAVNTSTTKFRLAGNQTWINNSSNTLTINGTITNNSTSAPVILTIEGTGNTALGGAISNNTATTALTKNGTGTLTLSAANTFSGGLILNSGTITANGSNTGTLGAGSGTLTINGGALNLQHTATVNYGRNATIAGNTTILSNRSSVGAGVTYTFGTLSIGANTLVVQGGGNVTSGTAGITFGATTLTGNAIFHITNPIGGGLTSLTMNAVTNGANTATLTGNGNFAQSGVWGSGAGGLTLGISGGTVYTGTASLSQANTFTGGVTINSGTAIGTVASSNFGTGVITLGDTTGSNNATLASSTGGTYTNNITVRAGSTGTLSIIAVTNNPTFSGNLALNNNLALNADTVSKPLTLSGAITQGANAVTVTKGTGAGAVNINGAITLGAGGLTLVNSGTTILTHSGGITGTGNLILQNNNSTASGITIQTASVNNNGTITNSGNGTGSVLISSNIGTNVKDLVQNSANSTLSLSGNNTFTGNLTITSGTARGSLATAFSTGRIILGDTTGSSNATLVSSNGSTHANNITVQAGSSGTLSIIGETNSPVFNGTVALNNNLTVDHVTSSRSLTLSGAITQGANAVTLTKGSGAGNAIISGATTLGAGGLTLVNSGAGNFTHSGGITGTGNLTINNNGSTLRGITISTGAVNNSGTITNSGSGAGSVLISSAIGTNVMEVTQSSSTSTLILSSNNTYTGPTTINSGTLQIGDNSTSGTLSSSGTIVNNGTLVFRNTGVLTQGTNFSSAAITGTGMVIQNSANSTTLNNLANSFGGGVWVQGGGTVLVDSIGNNGSNSFLGSGGTIKLGDSTNAGTLRITGNGAETTDKVIDLSGTTGGGTITNLSSNITFSSDLAMSGSGAKTLTLSSSGSNTSATTFNGLLSDANGVLSLRMNGSGNANFALGNAANSFSGSVIIDGNTSAKTYILSVAGIGNATQNSYLGRNATINIGSNNSTSTNVLQYTGAGETTDKVINLYGTVGFATIDQSGASGLLKFTSNMTASGVGAKTLTLLGSTAGTGEMAGVIIDSGVGNATSLVKRGTGTWTLSANNTYTGTTTIGSSSAANSGILRLSGEGKISNAATTIYGGTLDLNGTNQSITTLAMGGGSSSSTAAITTGSGTLTIGGGVTYDATNNPGGAIIAGNLNLGGAARTFTIPSSSGSGGVDILVSANISNDGGGGLTKAGAGVMELSGINSYTGNTTISSGTLSVSSIGNHGQNSAVGAGSMIELVNSASLVYTGSGDVTNRIISSTLSVTNQLPTLNQSGTGLLKFTSDLALSGNFTRTLVLTGSTSGTGEFAGNIGNFGATVTNLTKSGNGTWALSGANTYSGSTFINSGVLIVGSENGISGGLGVTGGNSAIDIKGGILGLTQASGNLTRSVGNSNSTIRLSNTVATRGFAAFGVNRSVRFSDNAATSVNLGASGGGDLNGGLVLSHSTADATLNFENGLGLVVGATRSIIVNNGSAAIDGIISGNITTSSGNWTTASILQIDGDGTLALTGSANTFGDGSAVGETFLSIDQATLQVGNNGTTGMIGSAANAAVQGDIQNDGVLRFALTSNQTLNNFIKGNGSVSKISSGSITLMGNNIYSGGTTISAGKIALSGNGTLGTGSIQITGGELDLGGNSITNSLASLTAGALINGTLTNDAGNYSIESGTVSAVLAGTNGLNKTSSGVLTLSGNNTYSGSTTITVGTISISGASGSLGSGNVSVGSGATLQMGNTDATTLSNNISGAGNLSHLSGAGLTTTLAGTNTNSGSIQSSGGGTLLFSGAGALSSNINALSASNNSTLSFADGEARTITLGNSGISLNTAALNFDVSMSASDRLVFSNAATLNGTNTVNINFIQSITGSGNWTLLTAASGLNGTWSLGSYAPQAGVTFSLSSNSTSLWLAAAGSSNFAYWTGEGGDSWAATNFSSTLNGSADIAGGALTTLSDVVFAATGAGNLSTTLNGDYSVNSLSVSTPEVSINGSNTLTVSSSSQAAINITATGNTTINANLAGAAGLTKSGNGTLTLGGNNSYTGNTSITGGTVVFGTNTAFGNSTRMVTLNPGSGNTITLESGANSLTLSNNFTLSSGTASWDTDSNNSTLSGVLSGNGALSKTGAGTLTLAGSNTYTGATTINAGTLSIAAISNGGVAGPLGNSTNAVGNLVLGGGTLQYTGSANASTDRNFTLTAGTTSGISVTNSIAALTISGSSASTGGGLTKEGLGTLILTGNNTYSGLTTISVGTLAIGSAGRLGGGNYSQNIINNGAFLYSGTTNQTLSGVISGTGALTHNTTGGNATTLTLAGNNTYTGATTVSTGILNIQHSNALGDSANGTTVASGAVLQLQGGITIASEVLTLTGSGVGNGGALINSSGNNDWAGNITIGSATTRIQANTGTTLTISGNIANNAGTQLLFQGGIGSNIIVSGIISGNGSLNTSSTGITSLTLSGANTYTSTTAINGGTVSINSIKDVGAGASSLGAPITTANGTIAIGSTTSSATLRYTGSGDSTSNRTINLAGTTGNATIDQSGAGALIFTSNLTATGGGSKTLILQGSTAGVGEIAGAVINNNSTNTTSLTKNGTGTWILSGNNTYTGATTINAGTLQIGNGGTSGILSSASAITNNATLAFNRSSDITQGTDFNSVIAGSGSLIQAGSGNLVLSGVNTYTGNTTVSSGMLQISNASALGGAGNGTSVTSGATLSLSGDTIIAGEALALSGAGVGGAGALRSLSGTNSWNATITLLGDTTIGSDSGTLNLVPSAGTITASNYNLTLTGAGNFTIARQIALGTGGLTMNGTGAFIMGIGGSSAYTGTTTINSGTLTLGNSNRINDSSALVVNGGRFKMDTFNETVAGVTLTGGNITSTTGVLTSTSDYNLQNGSISAKLAGSVGLNKTTAGSVTLSGNNTGFTGTTTINSGTLTAAAAGAMGNSSVINVNGGSFLVTAENAVSDDTNINLNGGRMAISGNFNENVGALTLSANSTIDFAGFSGVLRFSGIGSWAANTTLSVWNWSGTTYWGTQVNNYANPSNLVFTSNSDLSSNLANISFYSDSGNSFVGSGFEVSGFSGGGSEIIAVPEPETWLAAALLTAAAAYKAIRRRAEREPLEGHRPA